MNDKTRLKLQSLCLVSLQMAQESEKPSEFRSLILQICKQIEGLIDAETKQIKNK